MSLPHAQVLDVISVRPLDGALDAVQSSSLIRTARLQILHLVLPAHHDQPEHHLDDESTLHCLEGVVEVVMPGGTRRLGPGQLVLLPARQTFSLRARTDAAVLMTLIRHEPMAADEVLGTEGG